MTENHNELNGVIMMFKLLLGSRLEEIGKNPQDADIMRAIAALFLNAIPADQPLGTELFNAIARHSVGVAIETVLLRRSAKNGLEVYMTLRGADVAYANQWHVPGSYIRPGETMEDVLRRLSTTEYGVDIVRADFVKDFFVPEERFRTILDHIRLVCVKSLPTAHNGQWFPVENLPENTVDIHKMFIIPAAIDAYENWQPGIPTVGKKKK